jgi:hypothetical protein
MNYTILGHFAIRLVDRGTVVPFPVAARDFFSSKFSSSALRRSHPVPYSLGAGALSPKAKWPRRAA